MRTICLFLTVTAFALFSTRAFSQSSTFIVKGTVLDSADHHPLESATIYAGKPGDSTVLALDFTGSKGSFTLKGIPRDQKVVFRIFYTGYERYQKTLDHESSDTVDLGKIYLAMNANALSEVTVTGEKPPIAIKGDTVEFNASSFKTRPNSVLSGLLKKLPGVDIADDGSITANGKKVDKILVNGKKFFGDDPQIALQNLPAAIVDKVQVTDTKTEEEEATGDPARGDTKTINITLKKGNDHGFFGRAYAGYGTGDHYDASAMLNYFSGDRQISLLGSTNNINQTGFTMNEIASMVGNGNIHMMYVNRGTGAFGINGLQFGGGGTGLKKSTTAGVNFNDTYGKHFTVNGSYFYGGIVTDNETQTARQNILPDSIFYYNSDQTTHSDNLSNRFNATVRFKDSLWRITYTPTVSITNEKSTAQSSAESNGAKHEPVNESNSTYLSDNQRKTFNNDLYIYRTFKRKGQYLSLSLTSDNSISDGNDYNQYRNIFFDDSAPNDSANQYIQNDANSNKYSGRIAYSQPLSKAFNLNIAYELESQYSLNDKQTFNYDEISGKYSVPDTAYSNRFKSNIMTQTPRVGITWQGDSGDWRLDVATEFNFIALHHYSFTHKLAFDQNQLFIAPDIYFYKKISKGGRLNLNYGAYIRQPDISQLLPVADNTNPLYITKGNPDLKPSIDRNLSMGYSNYDFKSGNLVSLYFSYFNNKNAIVDVTSYDDQLRQVTTYTNVKYNDGYRVSINLSKTKKKPNYHWQIKMNSYSTLSNNHAFVNEVPYTSNGYNISVNPSVTYGYKELFELTPSWRFHYQFSKYDIKSLNDRKSIMSQTGLSGTLYWPGRITWESDLNYTHNSDVAPGFRNAFWLWNASVSLDVFKQRQGTLELSVYDLLNQNISVTRNIADTYIEDRQTVILHRYFMLKFTYNLRKFGEKKKKENHGPFFFF